MLESFLHECLWYRREGNTRINESWASSYKCSLRTYEQLLPSYRLDFTFTYIFWSCVIFGDEDLIFAKLVLDIGTFPTLHGNKCPAQEEKGKIS